MKQIIYLTQRFRPAFEATSKEVQELARYFDGKIHDLHLDGYVRFKFNLHFQSYHFLYYPLGIVPLLFFSRNKIIHLYTSLCDRPYLPFLSKKRMVLTSANFFRRERIMKKRTNLEKIRRIIVQSEAQKVELLEAGLKEDKIDIIYPPVNLQAFSYRKPSAKAFTVLNASCPGKVRHLGKRGIYLLLDTDPSLKDTRIKLLWRGGEFNLLKYKLRNKPLIHIDMENEIHTNMNHQYALAHCTIIPYLRPDEHLKTMPTSAIESLAAGKPILVSSQCGMAEIVVKERCGVIFEPTQESLLNAITEMKKNYVKYQRNCRRTAEKYFSQDTFLKKHKEIYESLS